MSMRKHGCFHCPEVCGGTKMSSTMAKREGKPKVRSVRVRDEDWSNVQLYASLTGRNVGTVVERLFQWFAEQSFEDKEDIMLRSVERDDQ